MPYFDEVWAATVRENFERADAFLLGRKTYEIIADYWPHADPANPIAAARSLLAAGLIDRHHLIVFPIALRSGARLFDGPIPPTKFRLEDSRTSTNGVHLLTFVPDGAPELGSFEELSRG